MDWEVWRAPGTLHRLEELVQAKSYAGRAVAGENPGHAVRAHVSEAGHSDYCRQFAAGEGPGGAQPRDPSGSADQEAAAGEDRELRSRERVSGKRVSGGAQPTLCPCGGKAGGLSRPEADRPRAA